MYIFSDLYIPRMAQEKEVNLKYVSLEYHFTVLYHLQILKGRCKEDLRHAMMMVGR